MDAKLRDPRCEGHNSRSYPQFDSKDHSVQLMGEEAQAQAEAVGRVVEAAPLSSQVLALHLCIH